MKQGLSPPVHERRKRLTKEVKLIKKLKDNLFINKGIIKVIRREYKGDIEKTRAHKDIRKLFDMMGKGEYTLDDQTWDDLDMDKVYDKLDRSYSSLGEATLYSMLRNPLMDEKELKNRDKLIEAFKDNEAIREALQYIFFSLNRDRRNAFLNMIESDLTINRFKYYLYTFLGKILPVIIILLAIFIDKKLMAALVAVSMLNMFINNNERNTIKSYGIFYLRSIIKAAKNISGIRNKDIIDYTDKIAYILNNIKELDRGTRLIGFANMWGGLFESLSVIFLIEESAYYAISSVLKGKKQYLMELYCTIGELEALLSISGYQFNLRYQCVKPRFVQETALNIEEGVHPLIDDAVPNSINIDGKGIVLTGTNMSGKSTFLRMLGVNMLLAQTFYFALAKGYEACFFNIVTSISPNDDLVKGKSYYMAEAESILRIIKALEKKAPVFCPIDEIFRGTNPIERISLSAEILIYLSQGRTISIAATHDRELADILKDIYEFYYFSEIVDSSKGLSFDYKLKKGVSQTRNAIKLLQHMNYPKAIIDNSYRRAEKIDGFI